VCPALPSPRAFGRLSGSGRCRTHGRLITSGAFDGSRRAVLVSYRPHSPAANFKAERSESRIGGGWMNQELVTGGFMRPRVREWGIIRGDRSVLIVDDDVDVRETLSDVLFAEGHHVVVASDGLDGLAALERCNPPTLVLLDHTMPRMDGPSFPPTFMSS
jgi:hypothetical protein